MMHAAVILKKLAIFLLPGKRTWKTLGGIVIGMILLFVIPVSAVISVFNNIQVGQAALRQQVSEHLSAEHQATLNEMERTMAAIETAMTETGFGSRVPEAQVLYPLALVSFSSDPDFISRLVGCFAENQTDAQLVAAVNEVFGTALSTEDFSNIMNMVRAVYIDTSGYTDPTTKNNLDLVQWAISAERAGWGYVWGSYGQVLDQAQLDSLTTLYPDEVGGQLDFISANWMGRRVADCIGFIKGYGWLNPESHEIEYGSNGMPDINANDIYYNAVEKGPISTMPEIPGLAVWREGHIGIYIGNGEVIHAMGTQYGVVKTPLSNGTWTHWLKIPYITYMETETTEETP